MNFKRTASSIVTFLVGQVSYRYDHERNTSLTFRRKIRSELSLCRGQLIFVGPKGDEDLSQISCLLYPFISQEAKISAYDK